MRRIEQTRQATAGRAATPLPLSEEAPVTITINDQDVATLLCTPRDLRELTVGWLFAEGLIEGVDEIVSLVGCAHEREMLVRTSPNRLGDGRLWRLITSGCGAGVNLGAAQSTPVPRVRGDLRLPLGRLRGLMAAMLHDARLYHLTGGVHSAALADAGGLVVLREDIGRHNAVDKVIGYGLLSGRDFGSLALLSTGRLSAEMAWKAARAGIPIVASLSIPSAMAYDVALAAGITLVGRALSARPLIYTHAEQIVDEA